MPPPPDYTASEDPTPLADSNDSDSSDSFSDSDFSDSSYNSDDPDEPRQPPPPSYPDSQYETLMSARLAAARAINLPYHIQNILAASDMLPGMIWSLGDCFRELEVALMQQQRQAAEVMRNLQEELSREKLRHEVLKEKSDEKYKRLEEEKDHHYAAMRHDTNRQIGQLAAENQGLKARVAELEDRGKHDSRNVDKKKLEKKHGNDRNEMMQKGTSENEKVGRNGANGKKDSERLGVVLREKTEKLRDLMPKSPPKRHVIVYDSWSAR